MSNENYKIMYEHAIDSNIKLVDENKFFKLDNERLLNIIKEVREKLNIPLAFTSSYQLNYQIAIGVIEEAKNILDKAGDIK